MKVNNLVERKTRREKVRAGVLGQSKWNQSVWKLRAKKDDN